MRRRLAIAVREELELRKRRLRVITYDDLLTRLDAALADEPVVQRLRERWKVVLVDEFQDTDPVQWSIVRRAFGDGTLVLIGDPKQAIYAFRGADVYAYLDAAAAASTRATLDVNWRSDQALLDAYDALFEDAQLGHPGIVYRRVRSNRKRRLNGAGAPLRIRVVERGSVETTPKGFARLASAREHVAADLAGDLVRLLSSSAHVGSERIRPGHVAVLVQTNRAAASIRDALDAVGIPAVINGAGSVFGTPAARDWLRLLEALERPTSSPRARAAALTPFLGWSAERVAASEESEWEAVHRRLHEWARVLRVRGVASLMEVVTLAEGLPERVLGAVEGERVMTDLRHVGELLHAAATTEQLGTTALVAWLRRRIAEAGQDTHDEDRSRRLESDAEAVQVLTVHRSKGLEFPVVYYPDLWEPGYIREGEPVAYHDPDADDVRTIDVGLWGADFNRHRRQHLIEQRGEDLRIAYVALTRAQHQAVVWWAPSWNSRHSSLGRLLFARGDDGSIPAEGRMTPDDSVAWERFCALGSSCVEVERSQLGLPLAWSGPVREPGSLAAARFERTLDRRWRRTSFTDITAAADEARVASEPEERVVTDEPVRAIVDGGGSPLAAMPAGPEVGTFIHRVLEATDFAVPDLESELAGHVTDEWGDPAVVVAGLRAAIETPLGPQFGFRLRDLVRADRLDELDFELPLVGGDAPRGRLALEAVADALSSADSPLAGYAERLRDPSLRDAVRGYLTGVIDLVARHDGRFFVLDYKSNRLPAYEPPALAAEMERAHYGLQALLYTVALHRYLRWRLPGYEPDAHLGGVGYLFLRGMIGADTPLDGGAPYGVFAWRPPGALVEALSDVLDRGAAT
jgi:exodeoxyribonuclease V beta subunit